MRFHPLAAPHIPATTLAAVAAFSTLAAPDVAVRMGTFPENETPAFTRGAVVEVVVSNASGRAISSEVALRVTRWDGEVSVGMRPSGRVSTMMTRLKAASPEDADVQPAFWSPGEVRSFSLPTTDLASDGYVLTVEADGKPLSEPRTFGLFASYEPRGLFGIGNGMVCEYWPGHVLCGATNAVEARDLQPVAIGKADAFEAAIVGAPQNVHCGVDYPSPSKEPDVNTPDGRHLHFFTPAGREELMLRARVFGERAARNPQWATAKLMNEQFYLNRGDFCPDKWADADFRAWLQERYGGALARLNAAWGTTLASWDEAAQPVSAAGGAGQIEKTGGEAIDWMAAMGKFTDESKAAIRRNPAQSLDWFRWRAWSVNRVYADYVAEAKRAAPGANVLYGNNYPWPNYFAHIIWPQWRSQDVVMLDLQYVCGFEKTLGNNEEMIDILEAAESIGKRFGKSIWGREVYYQPRYPGEVAALQNWAMVAHGMDVALVFAWKPYADWGREIFRAGTNSWEKPESPPMWFMIDTDGTRLPGYHAAKRSAVEIAALHGRIDMRKLRRIPGETALYWSTETSAYIMYQTFDRPYASPLAQARPDITAGLRYRGARVEFLDDAMLGELTPERFPVCVVPRAPVISDAALAKLRAYAERGGRLVLFAPFNTLDVNLRPKAEDNTGTIGWTGDILSINDFPGRYNPCPHDTETYARWFDDFVRDARIPRSAWWENKVGKAAVPAAEATAAKMAALPTGIGPGKGQPVVEVVVRRHAATGRRYAFVLNKGGAGAGRLCGPDFEGATLCDALTGETVSEELTLPAFGYKVLEIADGAKTF